VKRLQANTPPRLGEYHRPGLGHAHGRQGLHRRAGGPAGHHERTVHAATVGSAVRMTTDTPATAGSPFSPFSPVHRFRW
jgi:hypothetical protein